jgi:superfamily II DNA/RNA helicase
MADMGFLPAVRRLLDDTAPDRQTVLFSATLDGSIAALTRDYQRDPVRHEVGDATPDITAADHVFWKVDGPDRIGVSADLVATSAPAIIFCRTRHGADRLAKQLGQRGVKAAALHGGRTQGQRTRALDDLARGHVRALVATDVAARGIHVDGITTVIHYDPPADHTTYIHRSGRTARAGAGGLVVSLVQHHDLKDVRKMQRQVGIDVAVSTAPATTRRADDRPRTRR